MGDGDPRAPADRMVALDVLRAVALLGVLVENVGQDFRVSAFEKFLPLGSSGEGIDRYAERFVAAIFADKALVLLSVLFGMGLAAQSSASGAGGKSFMRFAARRAAFLLAVGLAHFVFLWSGDILALYAVAALLAAPLLRLPTRALAVLAAAMWILHVAPLPYPRPFAGEGNMRLHVEACRAVLGHATYGGVLAFRLASVRPALTIFVWMLPRTLALILAGAVAWRVGLRDLRERVPCESQGHTHRTLRSLPWIALGGIGFGALASSALDSGVALGGFRAAVESGSVIALGCGSGAAIALALELPILGPLLRSLAPLGTMTLTSYLLQSVLLGLMFYGYGFGLHGRVGPAAGLAIAVGIFAAQAVLADQWLRRYRFGPFEWIWRAWTYGAWPPMRRVT